MLTYPVERAAYNWNGTPTGNIDVIVSGVVDPLIPTTATYTYAAEECLTTDDGDTSYLRFTSGPTATIDWSGYLDNPPAIAAGAVLSLSRMVFVYRCTVDWPVVVTMRTAHSGSVPATSANNNLTLTSTGGAWSTLTWPLPSQFYTGATAPLQYSTLAYSALINQSPFPADYKIGAVEVNISRGTAGVDTVEFTHMRVEVDATAAPLRHRNRDDGLANSMARKGPKGPTSSQLSARRGPRAYS